MRTKRWAICAILLSASLSVACGSFTRDSYRALASFKAIYKTEEPIRESFCKGKSPQPEACVKAYKAAKVGYTAWEQAVDLLAIYAENKNADLKSQISALVLAALDAASELDLLKGSLQ